MQPAPLAPFTTRFILINPSHAGNVGAAARAMKVMGFDDLVLVAPRWANVLRREETIQRASGALDVLGKARIVETLDEALDGMTHLCATAMTPRDFGPPPLRRVGILRCYYKIQSSLCTVDKGYRPKIPLKWAKIALQDHCWPPKRPHRCPRPAHHLRLKASPSSSVPNVLACAMKTCTAATCV